MAHNDDIRVSSHEGTKCEYPRINLGNILYLGKLINRFRLYIKCTYGIQLILWCEAIDASFIPGIDFRSPKKLFHFGKNPNWQSESYLRAPRENLIGDEDVAEDLMSEPNDFLLAEENFPLEDMADVAFAAEA